MANAASIRIAKSLFLMASEERAAGWGHQWFGRSQHDKQTKKTPNRTKSNNTRGRVARLKLYPRIRVC
jgi:hypothetical protein